MWDIDGVGNLCEYCFDDHTADNPIKDLEKAPWRRCSDCWIWDRCDAVIDIDVTLPGESPLYIDKFTVTCPECLEEAAQHKTKVQRSTTAGEHHK